MSAKQSYKKEAERDPDFVSAELAFQRAVLQVRERAAKARLPVVVMRDGKIVEEIPRKNPKGRYAETLETEEQRACTVVKVFPEYMSIL